MKPTSLLGVALMLGMAGPASAAQSSNPLTNIFGSVATGANNVLTRLVECVELDLGVGPGVKLGLEACVVRIGGGRVNSTRVGFDGRQAGIWAERDAMMGLAPFSLLLAPCELMRGRGETWTGLANTFEVLTLGYERIKRDRFNTSYILYHESLAAGGMHQRPGDRYSLGGEAHLGYLGGRLRFKPVEFGALILSIFGMDIGPSLEHPEMGLFIPGSVHGIQR